MRCNAGLSLEGQGEVEKETELECASARETPTLHNMAEHSTQSLTVMTQIA